MPASSSARRPACTRLARPRSSASAKRAGGAGSAPNDTAHPIEGAGIRSPAHLDGWRTSMRSRILLTLFLVVLVVLAPADAATFGISISRTGFTPSELTVAVGD